MRILNTFRGARWLLGVSATIVLAACTTSSDPEIIRDPPTFATSLRGTIVAVDSGFPNDPITIDSARVDGDTLAVSVSDGGGCMNHTYQLVIGSAWMESFPVQVGARIAHDAMGDACKAIVRRDLRISLHPLASAYFSSYQQEHGTIAIRLLGYPDALLYKF